jgi:hypothetical protein
MAADLCPAGPENLAGQLVIALVSGDVFGNVLFGLPCGARIGGVVLEEI